MGHSFIYSFIHTLITSVVVITDIIYYVAIPVAGMDCTPVSVCSTPVRNERISKAQNWWECGLCHEQL